MAQVTEMAAHCYECGRAYEAHPADFLRHVTGLEPHEVPEGILQMGSGYWLTCAEMPAIGPIWGYCHDCADEVAARDREEYVSGRWNERDMEDEAFVWGR